MEFDKVKTIFDIDKKLLEKIDEFKKWKNIKTHKYWITIYE